MELEPSYAEDKDDSRQENDGTADDFTQLPPCICDFRGKRGAPGDEPPTVHFQISFEFTLWNEAANIPVLYEGQPILPVPRDLSSPDVGRVPGTTLKTVSIGACIDFRMPAEMTQRSHHYKDKAMQSPFTGPVPCIGQLLQDSNSTSNSYKCPGECPPLCNTFFNELLLAINLVIPELWCSGGLSNSYLSRVANNFPAQEHDTSNKGKSKLLSKVFDYNNRNCIPELPTPGEFRPAKILCHDALMASMIPYCTHLFTLTLTDYARGRALHWQHALSGGKDGDESEQEADSNKYERILYSLQGPKIDYNTDERETGRRKGRIKGVKEGSEAGISASTSPGVQIAGIACAAVLINKSIYVNPPNLNTQPQMLLLCRCCGTFGVDRNGPLPWPKLLRCSRCQTSW